MKKTFKMLAFVFVVANTTGCISDKPGREPIPGCAFTVNGTRFEMVFVEGGTFMMGCTGEQGADCEDNEKPAHEETVAGFFIGKYEVTQKLWNAVMGADPGRFHNSGCEDCPADRISWEDAQEFIVKLNALTNRTFRLPTETEWKYAARGGRWSEGHKYSGSDRPDEVAWYIKNYQTSSYGSKGTTHPVGMKKPNELGLYDMSGNVWEWCGDLYTKEYDHNGKIVHPEWPFKGSPLFFRRVLRGGSWGGTAEGCRVSYIDYDVAGYRDEYGGFRLVCEADSVQMIAN